jgi:hypothetical protein
MSDTPTPRTAAIIAKHDHILQYTDLLNYCKDMTVNSEQLERELAEAMDDAKTHKQMLQNLSKTHALERAELDRSFQFLTKQRDALAEALPIAMARAYERGYQCGHEDTVESRFVIVHANDALDYFADDIRQMLLDGSQPEAQKALTATKGGDA